MGATGAQGAAALTLTQAGTSAYAQYQAGKTNEIFANINADAADYKARDAISRGKTAVARHHERVAALLASQRVGFAAQGIKINEGSALEVQEDAARLAELDALTITNNAALEAFGYKAQARDARLQGRLGKQAATGEAINTSITGATKAAVQYRRDTE